MDRSTARVLLALGIQNMEVVHLSCGPRGPLTCLEAIPVLNGNLWWVVLPHSFPCQNSNFVPARWQCVWPQERNHDSCSKTVIGIPISLFQELVYTQVSHSLMARASEAAEMVSPVSPSYSPLGSYVRTYVRTYNNIRKAKTHHGVLLVFIFKFHNSHFPHLNDVCL